MNAQAPSAMIQAETSSTPGLPPTPTPTPPGEEARDTPVQPLYFAGLDLGQAGEYTALAVLERTMGPDPERGGEVAHYAVRHLERFPLEAAYTAVCRRLRELFSDPPLRNSAIVVDQTGVGKAVVDMIRGIGLPVGLTRVTITAGHAAGKAEGGGWLVPKLALVGTLQVLFQSRRLHIASALPDAATLRRELLTFRTRVPAAKGNETLEVWRERPHDDLVLAAAVAAWQGERYRGPWRLESFGGIREIWPGWGRLARRWG
jgi:hypothetical protein